MSERQTVNAGGPAWWDEMATVAELNESHSRHSAAWYASMRDQYLARFPNADDRSKANMRDMAEWAARREGGE